MYSRREFGQILGMSLIGSTLQAANSTVESTKSTVKGVRLGVISYSFNDMPDVPGQDHIDMVVQNCQAVGAGLVELMCNHAEPVTGYQMQQAAARAARMAASAANPNDGRGAAGRGGFESA
jgi:hypothetical protein